MHFHTVPSPYLGLVMSIPVLFVQTKYGCRDPAYSEKCYERWPKRDERRVTLIEQIERAVDPIIL